MKKFVALAGAFAIILGGIATWRGSHLDAAPRTITDPHDAILKHSREAMEQLKTGGIETMLAVLQRNPTLLPKGQEKEASQFYKSTEEARNTRFGKPVGEIEFVCKQSLSESMVRFVYLEKCERGAMIWRLTYYRIAGEWHFFEFNSNDNREPWFRTVP